MSAFETYRAKSTARNKRNAKRRAAARFERELTEWLPVIALSLAIIAPVTGAALAYFF